MNQIYGRKPDPDELWPWQDISTFRLEAFVVLLKLILEPTFYNLPIDTYKDTFYKSNRDPFYNFALVN